MAQGVPSPHVHWHRSAALTGIFEAISSGADPSTPERSKPRTRVPLSVRPGGSPEPDAAGSRSLARFLISCSALQHNTKGGGEAHNRAKTFRSQKTRGHATVRPTAARARQGRPDIAERHRDSNRRRDDQAPWTGLRFAPENGRTPFRPPTHHSRGRGVAAAGGRNMRPERRTTPKGAQGRFDRGPTDSDPRHRTFRPTGSRFPSCRPVGCVHANGAALRRRCFTEPPVSTANLPAGLAPSRPSTDSPRVASAMELRSPCVLELISRRNPRDRRRAGHRRFDSRSAAGALRAGYAPSRHQPPRWYITGRRWWMEKCRNPMRPAACAS